jgi:choline dehydrogenase-like flavoprotein
MQAEKKQDFDAIVVGSGAAGGMAAHELVMRGARVLMLEAGGRTDIATDYHHHEPPYDFRFRGGIPPRERAAYCYAANEWNKINFVNELDNPYTTAPGTKYVWVRARTVGGKTLHWGLVSLRLSPQEFKSHSYDGAGVDWPIDYDELAPWYSHVERLVGISGSKEGLPQLPDSDFLPAVNMSCAEQFLRKAVESQPDQRLIPGRSAIVTVPHNGRPPCHYCGKCGRVCMTKSSFSSLGALIPPALATGRLTLRTNSIVFRVDHDLNGKVVGVSYIDRLSKQEQSVRARVVVLGASSLESTRLLLLSKSNIYPNGIGNASGQVGRNYAEQVMGPGLDALVPQLAGGRPDINHPDDGRSDGSFPYHPRFRNIGKNRTNKFLRGYGYECGGGWASYPGYSHRLPGFGAAYKDSIRKWAITPVGMSGFGEVIARPDNYVELDPEKKDAWGIPVLRFHVSWGENEMAMTRDMADVAEEIAHAGKFEFVQVRRRVDPPGWSIHDSGTARMGDDPKMSVLNRNNQVHEAKNLFVVDGASFASASEKNPTLTILALSARAAKYISDEMKKGNL